MTLGEARATIEAKGLYRAALDWLKACQECEDPALFLELLKPHDLKRRVEELERLGGQNRPLFGIPFVVKDNIDVEGMQTTAACPAFAYGAIRDAACVRALKEAGALLLGKVNLDQFATGLTGTRSPFGVPLNPRSPGRIPGGSSSGSASAVARGLVPFSLGTDTAGSGRVPAAFQELVGLKPSVGALSNEGVVPACRSLDCVSVFANTLVDALQVFHAMGPNFRAPTRRLPSMRVAVPVERQRRWISQEYEEAYLSCLDVLRSLGFTVEEVDFGLFGEVAYLLYQGTWLAERWAALGNFVETHPQDVHPVTRTVLEGGVGHSAWRHFQERAKLEEYKRDLEDFWRTYEILVVPTAPGLPTVEEVLADPIGLNSLLGTYTNFVNLLDLSALAVPGPRAGALPFGITLVGPAGDEHRLASLAARFLGEKTPLPTPSWPLLAVAGAHRRGQPLNPHLLELGAVWVGVARTAAVYRMYLLPGQPPRPGLVRTPGQGECLEVELWALHPAHWGALMANIPAPLTLGRVSLEDGRCVTGFLAEGYVAQRCEDITRFGSWPAYLDHVR